MSQTWSHQLINLLRGNIEGTHYTNSFNWKSTADQVSEGVDLSGKIVLVTGANSGIGKEASRVFANRGAHVYLLCRNKAKATAAKEELLSKNPKAKLTLMELDLSSLDSVRKFSAEYLALGLPVHVLVLNAGIMGAEYVEPVGTYESHFGTNHLGHFLLTQLLLPRLKEGAPSRVVVVASMAHRVSSIWLDDLSGKGTWNRFYFLTKWWAYGQSKTANILFANELNRRMREENVEVYANSLHPGVIHTNLGHDLSFVERQGFYLLSSVLKSVEQGAATTVYVGCSPSLAGIGGKYFSDSNEATPLFHATDVETGKRLWSISEDLCQIKADQ